MTKLVVTRGLQGSGKTTRARVWVAEDPMRRVRVNRDDYRAMFHGGRLGTIERDATRTGPACVGEAVIRDMWNRYVRGKPYPLPLPAEPAVTAGETVPYVPKAGTPRAVLCDLDGTAALMCARSPYDETRVGEDRPNLPVIAAVQAMHAAGHAVVFLSARTEGCREATEKWLGEHVGVSYEALYMRAVGDTRKDSVVKAELFDREIRDRWTVVAIFDDRDQVVQQWRSMGLTCFQVAPGAF